MNNSKNSLYKLILTITCFIILLKISGNELTTNRVNSSANEIIFHSNGATFSPVITLQGEAEILWTWADNTTSTSLSPVKNYGSAQLRTNRLKVTPWSALKRINIGYDAEDGGSNAIELVPNQNVSLVENLSLASNSLKEWCSSYNPLQSLDFSNFTNLETIECYGASYLSQVNLSNTINLKRICLELTSLQALDLSDCNALEDLRAAINKYPDLILPANKEKIWHLCTRDNPQMVNVRYFNNMSAYPLLGDLFIWNMNQEGELIIPNTSSTRKVEIHGYDNRYSAINFSGALKNTQAIGIIEMQNNVIEEVNISGCIQITSLNLWKNKLQTDDIDKILKEIDSFGTSNGRINLRFNAPPSFTGLIHKANLANRGWTIETDINIPIQSITVSSTSGNTISTDNGTLQLQANVLPTDATSRSVTWSVLNETGRASISATGLLTAEKNGTVKAIATATDGSGKKGEFQITISNQIIPVQSVSISSASGNSILIDNGTLQLQANILPEDATTKSITWSLINETGMAKISTSGLVTAEKNGVVKAIATSNDGSGNKAEFLIVIYNQIIQVQSISVTSISGNLISSDNGTLQLLANVLPTDATSKSIIWSIINETGKASISSSGLVTAEKDGSIKAVATASDGSGIKGEYAIIISNQIIPVQSVSISSNSGNTISTNKGTLQLQANILPSDATTKSVIWTIMNETGKASVSSSGSVTAEKNGTVKVIATSTDGSGIKGEYQIIITNQTILIQSISISSVTGNTITTDNGILQLQYAILPTDASSKTVTWSISNLTGKATISTSGLVTAEKNGTVTAIATATDGSGIKGEFQITISNQTIPVQIVSVSSFFGNAITTDNGTLQLQANVLPTDATLKTVSWSIKNITGKASISATGVVTAEKNGTVTAVATAADGSGVIGEFQISISNQIIPIQSISIQDGLMNDTLVGIGKNFNLSAKITPNDATNQEIEWSVENLSGKATINTNGILTTQTIGQIKVIATSKSDSKVFDMNTYNIVLPLNSEEFKHSTDFKIFPNPTNDRFIIEIDKFSHEDMEIKIHNFLGQCILNTKIIDSTTEWSLSKYPSGIYFVTIYLNETMITQKLIKN
ncbi:MAG: Ig-like domain-containing protein [Prolixibacteraceae bacterium]|nr:Ig-like domain-containing protein [Prolixibacteraceae bacterium]